VSIVLVVLVAWLAILLLGLLPALAMCRVAGSADRAASETPGDGPRRRPMTRWGTGVRRTGPSLRS